MTLAGLGTIESGEMKVPSAWVVVAGVVVHQAGGGALLSHKGVVGPRVAGCAALGAVGVVGAASCLGAAARGERGAAEVVAAPPASSGGPDWTTGASGCGHW